MKLGVLGISVRAPMRHHPLREIYKHAEDRGLNMHELIVNWGLVESLGMLVFLGAGYVTGKHRENKRLRKKLQKQNPLTWALIEGDIQLGTESGV